MYGGITMKPLFIINVHFFKCCLTANGDCTGIAEDVSFLKELCNESPLTSPFLPPHGPARLCLLLGWLPVASGLSPFPLYSSKCE
jgi:hypothetical protein